MTMHSKWVSGNLVYYNNQSWLDAVGPNVCKFVEEFTNSSLNVAAAGGTGVVGGWTATITEAGGGGDTTLAQAVDGLGGWLTITTDNADGDGANCQVVGESFTFSAAYPTYFGARFRLNTEITECGFLIGLCITDTTLLAAMNEGVYFRKADDATTLNFVLEENTAETAVAYGTALTADTWYKVEFYYDGSAMHWWVNDVEQTQPALTNLTNVSTVYLTPSFHYLTGKTTAYTADIDWIRAFQIQTT